MEEETYLEDDSPQHPPSDIIAYNELRSCADLFRMYRTGILEIQPEFQREIVWKTPAQTRFVDSLVKRLPIPSMCFSLDYRTDKWMVIDGLQRMATIAKFLSGENWKLSNLEDIEPELAGKTAPNFRDPNSPLHKYYTRVENLSLPVTVLRCDYSKGSHMEYLFTIFHRLNSGGTKLNNQEIRNCIFSGPFNELLKKLNKDVQWKKINRMKSDVGYRFTKQELILRLFAFHERYEKYSGRLAKFLNAYMLENRNPGASFLAKKSDLFTRTIEIVYNRIFEGKIPAKLSLSVQEATLVGVARNINSLEVETPERIQLMFDNLVRHDEFSDNRLSEGLAKTQRLKGRMQAAVDMFSESHS